MKIKGKDKPVQPSWVRSGSVGEITVFVNLGTNADVSKLAVGQLIDVTGFSSQFEDHYEIDIRGPQDLAQPVK